MILNQFGVNVIHYISHLIGALKSRNARLINAGKTRQMLLYFGDK